MPMQRECRVSICRRPLWQASLQNQLSEISQRKLKRWCIIGLHFMPVKTKSGPKGSKPTSATAPERKKAINDPSRYFSRAVGKALELLELLQLEQTPMGLNEITRRIRLSKTSTFRLLRTLEISGAVSCTPSGQYRLAGHIGVPPQRLAALLRVATPVLEPLSLQLGETVSLAALFENRIEVIAVYESPQLVRMSNVVGHILPPHASSLGKAITAFQPPERRDKLLRSLGVYQYTLQTITDRAKISQEYELVRQQCFAVDREETIVDGVCFGVPVSTASGDVTSAISTSLPKTRVRGQEHEDALIRALTRAASEISTGLS